MAVEDHLLDLLDSWQIAATRGRAPTAAELCADRPDLVGPLAERIAVLEHIARLGHPPEPGPTPGPGEAGTVDYAPHASETGSGAPAVGDMFGGFRLLGVLGAGGFGTVFRAEDVELRRKVALKVLHERALARPGADERFLAEARALAAVGHDHVVPVLQTGRVGGRLFLAMPLLGGETLAARIEREGALPPAEVRRVGRETAAGLAAIHAHGLVHRDLKPANLWLESGGGRVKVLDLGLAYDPLDTGRGVVGTPAYMSPEQAAGRPLDLRSDLFSLGAVLYECATGRRPFDGTTIDDTRRRVLADPSVPLARLNPGLPADLGAVIERLLRKDPADRSASAAEVEALLRGDGPAPPSRRRRLATLVAVVLVPLLAYLTWSATRPRDGRPVEPGPPPAAPLRVLSLEVNHYASAGPAQVDPRGVFGRHSFGAVMGDDFDALARLSRPAYAYLIVFRPDGKDEVLYPQDDGDPPAETDAPVYPSKRRKDRYMMEEGTGLWLVALVASDRPLPAYRDWRAGVSGNPWKPAPGTPDRVWYDDGQFVEVLDRGRPGVRGGREAADKAPVVGVTDWLREVSGGTAAAVAFTVRAKE